MKLIEYNGITGGNPGVEPWVIVENTLVAVKLSIMAADHDPHSLDIVVSTRRFLRRKPKD
jgi:hypothetical protein